MSIKPGNAAGKALLVLFGLLLPLATLELASRVYARLTSQERTVISDSVLGWRNIPYSRHFYRQEAQPYHIVINSKGLRDREHSYEKPPGTFRILVTGDSFVFGSGGVEPSSRFTDILERTLKNVEIINTGVPAYGTDQEYLYLKTEGLKYHPDLVILCIFSNDFVESFSTVNPSNGRPKGYFSSSAGQLVFHPPAFSLFYELSQHSYLLGRIQLFLSRHSRNYWKKHTLDVLSPQERADTFRQMYSSAQSLCRDHGAKFLLVYFPFRGEPDGGFIQTVVRELAATEGTRTLDLTDRMARANAESPTYFRTDIHFNEHGHEVVAEALREYLVANILLDTASSTNVKLSLRTGEGHQ
jgi:lysophospholipase L1-like esterase